MTFLELAQKRCSIRKYDSRPIEAEKMNYLLESVRMAPSAVNYQPWCFIVIESSKGRERLQACYPREWFKQAPCYVIACGDRQQSWKRNDGKDHLDIDVAIATEHLCLAAAELGLGSCWVCNFDTALCREYFQIPSTVDPIALIPLGYPANPHLFEETPKTRKNITEIIKQESF